MCHVDNLDFFSFMNDVVEFSVWTVGGEIIQRKTKKKKKGG